MPLPLPTRKMLWGRSGNRCAICKKVLAEIPHGNDEVSVLGEECHIVSRKRSGPRGNTDLPDSERDSYANLILLCANHHTEIDDKANVYTVQNLMRIKEDHEAWVEKLLEGYDSDKQKADEAYANIIEELSMRLDFANWRGWTQSFLHACEPSLASSRDATLRETPIWLLSRIWSHKCPEIEAAIANLRHVLQDLLNTFHEHSEEERPGVLTTCRFYKLRVWDKNTYDELAHEYGFHCALIEDLVLELTRAANYLCDMVREHLFPGFRVQDGALLVERGPGMELKNEIVRVEYRGSERTPKPYRGIEDFLERRSTRDYSLGFGRTAKEETMYFAENTLPPWEK